jgi:RNA polymerase sigma factor (sigma-70 family)
MPKTSVAPAAAARRGRQRKLSASALDSRSDEQLVELIRRGHPRAFELLAARYRVRLLSFCRRMLKSNEDGEDALQEVFVSAFNAILSDDREIQVRPWLYRIATNRCINHLRRASMLAFDALDDSFAASTRTGFEELVGREELRELVCDIRTLPARQRAALLLREVDGLSYDQIAIALTATMPAVKSLLVRARFGLLDAAAARDAAAPAHTVIEPGELIGV